MTFFPYIAELNIRKHKEKIERFHGSMKRELLNHNLFKNLDYADKALQEWRTKYNCLRPHEALGNKCPADVYTHSESDFC